MHVQRLNSVNGKLIKWAREDSGYTVFDVARYCGLKDEETIIAIEEGTVKPTINQAEKIAKKVNRPLAFFYLEEVPADPPKQTPDNRSPMLATTLGPQSKLAMRKLYLIQERAAELQKLLNLSPPELPHFSRTQTPLNVASEITKYLGIEDMPRMLHRETALEQLIEKVEAKRIVVSMQSMHRTELQGASVYKPYPMILINHTDYQSSKIFTLIHELCHLGLRSGGTCLIETSPTKAIETFCNQVAGETLVPAKELKCQLSGKDPASNEVITKIADYFSVSREVVLLRLIHEGYLGAEEWDIRVPEWRKENGNGNRHFRRASSVTRALRENGRQYTKLVIKSFNEGTLAPSEASRYLNIRGGILEDVRRKV